MTSDINYDATVLTLDSFTLTGALGSMAGGQALDFSLGLVSPGAAESRPRQHVDGARSSTFCKGILSRSAALVFHGGGVAGQPIDDGGSQRRQRARQTARVGPSQ
jgi:hypothetical protein